VNEPNPRWLEMPPAKNGLVLLSLPDGFGELVQLLRAATVCEVGLASMLAWPIDAAQTWIEHRDVAYSSSENDRYFPMRH
jgi:hypothetical protein